MKKIFIAAMMIAAIATSCSKSDSTSTPKTKTAIDVDLKAYLGYMNANLSSIQSAYKNNIDTTIIVDGETVFAVQMKDSVQPGTPLYVVYGANNGKVSEIYITSVGTATIGNHQTIARKYGNLSESLFGEVYIAGTLLNDEAQKSFTSLTALWNYIDAYGYSGFDQYDAFWNYNQNGVVLIYSNTSGFEWGAQNTTFGSSANANVLQNKMQVIKKAIFPVK